MAKGKRWAKGQSSSSNPTSRKYRDISKNNRAFFSFGLPATDKNSNSQLTRKALAELDSMSMNNDNHMDAKSLMSDNESDADTFKSWASNWSDCTNATFNKVHKYWQSNSSLHKEILAVLAAITEVIKENNGKENETEYFAALMTGLDSVKENEESTTAFLYLIALAIKKVPENVLRAKFGELVANLVEPLIKFGSEKANNTTLIKSSMKCLCWLLKSQDKQAWEKDVTIKTYLTILNFIEHPKPKIRKCGQEAIRLILNSCNSSDSPLIYEYVTSETANYCLNLIVNNGKHSNDEQKDDNDNEDELKKKPSSNKEKKNEKQTAKKESNNAILHTLQLLKCIIHHFQVDKLKSIIECLLSLMTLKDILITSNCFQVLHQLFNSQSNHLSGDLNAQIINALYDYQPSENDPPQLIGWLAVTESAIKCLNRLNKEKCITHLPHFFQIYMQILSLTHHKNIHVILTNCLNDVLEQCVQTNINLLIDDLKMHGSNAEQKKSLLYKIFSQLENGLSYQFHESWLFVMKILTCAFTSFKHRDTFPVVEKCLSSLANLRESDQFEYKKEADMAIGRAVQTYGPRLMLECISLGITGDEDVNFDYPRSWMLPILKDNIQKTELSYFINVMLPLANKLKAKSAVFLKSKQQIQYKVFDNLVNQIWSLLPGFCDFPPDFAESFKNLAKTLGETLEKCSDLRNYVLQSLRTLINRNTDENKALMVKYAKNYLSIMFNVYTTEIKLEKDPVRQSLLDTIKCYMKIADPVLLNTFLTQSIQHFENHSNMYEKSLKPDLNNNNGAGINGTSLIEIKFYNKGKPKVVFDFDKTSDSITSKNTDLVDAHLFAKNSFLDLISFLVKYTDEKNVNVVYELAMKGIENKVLDKTLQKKCYKILDSILKSGQVTNTGIDSSSKQNESISKFIDKKFQSITSTFVASLSDCNAAAKVPRLKCLLNLMEYVKSPEQKVFLRQILPEVILCIKEINFKSREASFSLLNSMLRLWQKLSLEGANVSEIDSLNEFMHLVMVGLAGSTNMISCTCLALTSLATEFKENISGSLISDLIETSCLLAKSEHKEIVISSLNLLKVLCAIFTQSTLAQYLNRICEIIRNLHEKRSCPTNVTEAQAKANQSYFNNIAPVGKSQQIRSFVKLILKKLIKKFSYEIVHEKIFKTQNDDDMEIGKKTVTLLTGVVRQGLENLLLNIKKSIEKDKKRKLDEINGKKKSSSLNDDLVSVYTTNKSVISSGAPNYDEVEDLLKDSDDSDDEEKQAEMKSQKSSKTNKTNKSDRKSEKKSNSSRTVGTSLAWLRENENEDPLDLLDPLAIKRVLATKPLTKEELEKKRDKEMKSKSKNRGFKMEGGKLLIDDDSDGEESDDEVETRSKKQLSKKKQPNHIEEMMDTLSLSKMSTGGVSAKNSGKKNKLKRHIGQDDSDDSDNDAKSKFSYKSGGTGIHRKVDKSKKSVDFGDEYRSKKARGDVKIKNKPDPYAYLPLNFSKLNRRKRAKLEGEYKGVVKAVRKGVQKGKKSRQKRL